VRSLTLYSVLHTYKYGLDNMQPHDQIGSITTYFNWLF